ncbi:membrane protein [Methylobacterium haplocladii]|uniref:Membrane protein n=1 Tax=Methylobacterium haplocladii TaxID=1176176 RepID=A0A512IKA5_9HYPH|nr:membrane protein [Methylobacterium haplocladii]GLS60358.1 membrane protein [Methylobacterium haplocladii]
MLRASKLLLVAGIALTCSLVVTGNVVDPAVNRDFVRHVLSMDTVEPGSAIRGRAITDPGLQQAAFMLIVASEALVAGLCWIGAALMVPALRAPAPRFAAAKAWAIAGLTLGVLVFQTGFMGIGGEWFGMWMSKTWNGQDDAFRFVMILLGVLIYVALPEGEA